MTLLELLLVMGILALVLGIGVGAFARLDFSERTVAAELQSAVRAAHNWAVAQRAPARVLVDRDAGTVRAEGRQIIGTWHFEESPIRGALDLDGVMHGGFLSDDGYQGKALCFSGEPPRAGVEVAVHQDPAYDFELGFTVELAVAFRHATDSAILTIGNDKTLAIQMRRDRSIRALFTTRAVEESGKVGDKAGGVVILNSPAGGLLPGRWYVVRAHYDRSVFQLSIDGRVVDSIAEDAPVFAVDGPLYFGGGSQPFDGRLDNVVISAVAGQAELTLPVGTSFAKESATEVRFDPGGRLDPMLHQDPVALVLEFEDGRRHELKVNLYGTVE